MNALDYLKKELGITDENSTITVRPYLYGRRVETTDLTAYAAEMEKEVEGMRRFVDSGALSMEQLQEGVYELMFKHVVRY